MRKTLTILFVACSSMANAQNKMQHPFSTGKGQRPDKFHAHVMNMLQTQLASTAQKTTAMKERVIAETAKDQNMILMDTTVIKYVGTNGSRFDYNFMMYNYGYSNFGFTPNNYPYDFSQLDVKHDSIYGWSDNGSGLDLVYISTAQHSTAGLLNELEEINYDAGSLDYADIYANSFDAQGRFSQLIYLENNGSGYDSVGKLICTYDANGEKIADTVYDYSAGSWDLSGLLRYTYNSSGLLDSLYQLSSDGAGGWDTDLVYVHTHDNAGRLETVVGYADFGSGLAAAVADTFTYTGNNTYFTSLMEYQYSGAGLEPTFLLSKHIGATNLPDTMWYSQYDFSISDWLPIGQVVTSYNSNNNPVKQEMAENISGNLDLVATYNYYYELYDDAPQNVHNTVKNAAIILYPNPVISELNMTWSDADGKQATVELANAAGQKLYTRSFTWKEKNQKISLMNLSQGMYWVVIRNAAGAVIYRQSIMKQ